MLTAKAAAAALSVSGFLVENMLTTRHGRTHLDRENFLIKNHRSTILLQCFNNCFAKKWNDGRAVMSARRGRRSRVVAAGPSGRQCRPRRGRGREWAATGRNGREEGTGGLLYLGSLFLFFPEL